MKRRLLTGMIGSAFLGGSLFAANNNINVRVTEVSEEAQLEEQKNAIGRAQVAKALATIDKMKNDLNDLADDFIALSEKSKAQAVPYDRFKAIFNAYQSGRRALLAETTLLKTMTAITGVDLEERAQAVQDIVESFDRQLDFLTFQVLSPDGKITTVDTENFYEVSKAPAASPEQVAEIRKKIMLLRVVRAEDKRVIDSNFNGYTMRALQRYVEQFGVTQRYRNQENERGLEAARAALAEVFWARSYIRAQYGISIGSFGIQYDKKAFNTDLLSMYNVLEETHIVHTDAELTTSQDLMVNAIRREEARLGDNKSTTSEKDKRGSGIWTSIVGFASSGITYLGGRKQEAGVSLEVLDLIRQDIEDEQYLRKEGFKAYRKLYKDRYASPEGQAFTGKMKKRYFPSEEDLEDPERDMPTSDPNTLAGSLEQCKMALENQENRLDEAEKLEKSLATLNANNNVAKRRLKRESI